MRIANATSRGKGSVGAKVNYPASPRKTNLNTKDMKSILGQELVGGQRNASVQMEML